tara:strand:- start:1075 stop:1335 length:261 start_codon:yes stop_codon:yes gene_type:complete
MLWEEEAKQYLKQYNGDTSYTTEYVENLVPQYYVDIMEVATLLELYHGVIDESNVGENIATVLQHQIFLFYQEKLFDALTEILEEE